MEIESNILNFNSMSSHGDQISSDNYSLFQDYQNIPSSYACSSPIQYSESDNVFYPNNDQNNQKVMDYNNYYDQQSLYQNINYQNNYNCQILSNENGLLIQQVHEKQSLQNHCLYDDYYQKQQISSNVDNFKGVCQRQNHNDNQIFANDQQLMSQNIYYEQIEQDQYNQYNSSNTQLDSLTKNSDQISKNELKIVEYHIQLLKPVMEKQNYYLIGDISIDFDLLRGKESRFSPLSEFRPVVSVQRNLFQQFVEIQIGQYEQGITDFRFVVEKLNSMNDQFAHGIAILLSKYQKLIDFKLKMSQSSQKMISDSNSASSKFDQEAFWQEALEKAKTVIAQKRKENKYLAYFFKKGSYLEDTMITQGYSEQLLEVLGLDHETFRQISLRKGLIDFVEPISRYFIIVEQFANVAKKKMPWEDINLISIDNFKIPVKVQAEKITLNKYKCFENYIGFMNIDISQKVIQDLKLKRYRARNMLENQSYYDLGEELTYSFETELFLDRYYSQQKAQAIIEAKEQQKKQNEEDEINFTLQYFNQKNNQQQQNQQRYSSSQQTCSDISLNDISSSQLLSQQSNSSTLEQKQLNKSLNDSHVQTFTHSPLYNQQIQSQQSLQQYNEKKKGPKFNNNQIQKEIFVIN